MAKFDVMKIFGVYDAHDCKSLERALSDIQEAGKYAIDYASDLNRAKEILEQRKIELGCK